MRIALVAPPFIAVPPADYGGTELFVAQLAEGLRKNGVEVVVYANGESTVNVERRSRYEHSQWPIKAGDEAWLKELDHTAWAVQDAAKTCDVIHVQSPQALPFLQFASVPMVLTLHGPHNPKFSDLYARFPRANYVAISEFQRLSEVVPRIQTIYHGIDLGQYLLREQKKQYLSFIGRIAPIKGTHTAIEVAKRTGVPLKIAGDIQPMYREYFEAKIKPKIDGKLIEYVGLADLQAKNELLGNSFAMLFPIQWNEPFGLVMVEAMACGTPVLAFKGGSVPEIVRDGVSGYVCRSVGDMVKRVTNLQLDSRGIRQYVEENFSLEHMVSQYISLYRDLQNANPLKAA
jgi:glycosyltransferase involved in cell wall biosynthesis